MSDQYTVLIRGVLTARHDHLVSEQREHRLAREVRGTRRPGRKRRFGGSR
jgi:hypothetical protein